MLEDFLAVAGSELSLEEHYPKTEEVKKMVMTLKNIYLRLIKTICAHFLGPKAKVPLDRKV